MALDTVMYLIDQAKEYRAVLKQLDRLKDDVEEIANIEGLDGKFKEIVADHPEFKPVQNFYNRAQRLAQAISDLDGM